MPASCHSISVLTDFCKKTISSCLCSQIIIFTSLPSLPYLSFPPVSSILLALPSLGLSPLVFGRNVTSVGWQVTLCDPIWHVSSRSGVIDCELLYPYTFPSYSPNSMPFSSPFASPEAVGVYMAILPVSLRDAA